VGDDENACTSEIRYFKTFWNMPPKTPIIFADAPGFNDTKGRD
jgi:hypothetical protein